MSNSWFFNVIYDIVVCIDLNINQSILLVVVFESLSRIFFSLEMFINECFGITANSLRFFCDNHHKLAAYQYFPKFHISSITFSSDEAKTLPIPAPQSSPISDSSATSPHSSPSFFASSYRSASPGTPRQQTHH